MSARQQLITSDKARQCKKQHTTPCSDCPWARKSLPGWLGPHTVDEWLAIGHSDTTVPCHVIDNQQCAGIAIYRANVVKRCDPPNLKLPRDEVKVFGFHEFRAHHERFSK